MSKIHALPQNIIAQIAAGQVVERPSSVVKELIENSIDSGATKIDIELEKGGLQMIRVVDNGQGMDKSDLQMSALPHTTSKIHTEDDLREINSLGFRGEALSSIASVATLIIKSRKGKVGNKLDVRKNKVIPIGMMKGTIVEVFDLFSKIPARKKDLRSTNSELKEVTNVVLLTALAHSDISFTMTSDGKEILQVHQHSLRERVESLLGEFISSGLVPVSSQLGNIKIRGFIGTPQTAIKQKTRQFLYVNLRPVKNEMISSHVKNLYGTLLDPRLNPTFLIFIETPADYFDINIHPRKEEVRFYTPDKVLEAIEKAVATKLKTKNYTYQFTLQQSMSKKTAFVIKDAVSKWSVKTDNPITDAVIQVDSTFLVTQTNKSLLIIDQHAAHERILFEQFSDTFNSKGVKSRSVKLTKPVEISLPVNEKLLFEENIILFNKLGFKIDKADSNFSISKIPLLYKDHDLNELISEVIHDVSLNHLPDTLTQRTLSFLACRSAIKAGDELTDDEVKRLLEKLYKTKTSYTCPHGRPVLIEIPLTQLHIAFRRK